MKKGENIMDWITVILAVMYLCGANVGTALAICALISSLLSLYLAIGGN